MDENEEMNEDEIYRHIRHPHISKKNKSICGQDIRNEWNFLSIEHWYLSQVNGDRLLGCLKCLKKINKVMTKALKQ